MASSNPAWVLSVEQHLEAFLTGDARRESLPPMTRPQRAVVHELARELAETQGVSGSMSAVERTWLDATVTAATGGVEMFDGASGSTDEKFPGHLHVAPDGKLVISRPKTLT